MRRLLVACRRAVIEAILGGAWLQIESYARKGIPRAMREGKRKRVNQCEAFVNGLT